MSGKAEQVSADTVVSLTLPLQLTVEQVAEMLVDSMKHAELVEVFATADEYAGDWSLTLLLAVHVLGQLNIYATEEMDPDLRDAVYQLQAMVERDVKRYNR